jgi:hypothetical protein
MTKPKQTGTKKSDNLVEKLDAFALELLAATEGGGVQQKVDIFKEIARWVGIKNRLDTGDTDEGSRLNGYRDQLANPAPPPAEPDRPGRAINKPGAARAASLKRWAKDGGPDTADDNGGSALDAIKSRLPRGSDLGDVRDLDDTGGEDDDTDGDSRGFRLGPHGGL